MVKFIWCNYTPYTKEEKAREILFKGANSADFVEAFVWDGVQYFKKIK